ncbi:MAG: hypothetical protein AAGF96_05045 [Bacteroidota bacterium]
MEEQDGNTFHDVAIIGGVQALVKQGLEASQNESEMAPATPDYVNASGKAHKTRKPIT